MSDATPRHDLTAERVVLSAALLDDRTLSEVRTILQPEDCYDPRHVSILRAAYALDDAGKPAQLESVYSWLSAAGKLGTLTSSYLADVVNATQAVTRFADYARTVLELANLRRAGELFGKLSAEARTGVQPAAWVTSALERVYAEVGIDRGGRDSMATAKDVSAGILAALDVADDGVDRISTGLAILDRQTGGLRAGGIHLIAARPGVGKSAVALQMAMAAAATGIGVAVFTLEMSRADMLSRTLASFSGIDHTLIDQKQIPKAKIRDIRLANARLSALPLVIDDNPRQTVGSIRAMVRRGESVLGRRIGLIVVDYIQLMAAGKAWSKRDEISQVSHGLLALAKDLNVPVLACAQLNRNSESRSNKDSRPHLSDLGDCGDLERDARTVIMLWREDRREARGPVEFLVRKCRQGGREGEIIMHWDGPTMTVSERPPAPPDGYEAEFDSGLYGEVG